MNIVDTISQHNYVATEAQVALLAHEVTLGQRAEGTYLRVVLNYCHAELGPARRKRIPTDAQLVVLDKVHARFYPHVQKGVGPEDMTASERHAKSTFARSSVSELRGYVIREGDLRRLVVAEVTKSQLRRFGKVVPTGTRAERSLLRAATTIARSAMRVAKADPVRAREQLEAAIEIIQAELNALPSVGRVASRTHVHTRRQRGERAHVRTRVGTPVVRHTPSPSA